MTVTGTGVFTGAGDLFLSKAKLQPWKRCLESCQVSMEAICDLGADSNLLKLEIGGTGYGEFDRHGNRWRSAISMACMATVMWDNYQLGFGEEFIFGDVQGDVFGQFQNFGEGDLVGNFNGVDLFITYRAGDGNDLGLFSAVPEPGSGVVLLGLAALVAFRRRRV